VQKRLENDLAESYLLRFPADGAEAFVHRALQEYEDPFGREAVGPAARDEHLHGTSDDLVLG
jgi:hypothetical protein